MNAADLTPGFKVRLRVDLSRYHAGLKIGAEGVTAIPSGRCALQRNAHLTCRFSALDGGDKEIDVRLGDLEITDPRWLTMIAGEKAARDDALANHVRKATLYVGARGGFRRLVVEFDCERINEIVTRSRDAQAILATLRPDLIFREVQ